MKKETLIKTNHYLRISLFKIILCAILTLISSGCKKASQETKTHSNGVNPTSSEIHKEGEAAKSSGDYLKATDLFRRASKMGNDDATVSLALLHYHGKAINDDNETFLNLLHKSAERNHARSLCILGIVYIEGRNVNSDTDKGIKYLEKSVLLGNEDAKYTLGWYMLEGKIIDENLIKGASLIKEAAINGDLMKAAAQYKLSECYQDGIGLPIDKIEAQKWLTSAAELGNIDAMKKMAKLATSDKQATEWVRKAAEKGDYLAQYDLAMRLEKGVGCSIDMIEAYMWLNISSMNGDIISSTQRDIMAKKLSSKDLSDAQTKSTEWIDKNKKTR